MNSYILEQEIMRRRDMRDVLTFTIDPDDAKDYDDALSFKVLENGLYEVGVHIADVSFFVQQNTEIDEEAYTKGTSVYLVDKVIPMLPSKLCDDICSLREGEDRLCKSVVFTVDENANIIKYKLCPTVICSNARLTYKQAQQMLDGALDEKNDIQVAINFLWHVASLLKKQRIKHGAITISQEEVRFILNDTGQPIDIYLETPHEANFLIEEWMLLTNRTVATLVRNRPFIYRIHDKPLKEKITNLQHFKKVFPSHNDPFMNKLTEMMTIRSMEKAIYSTHNIGHYGLAFKCYTHFTSPIRRYPDLLVHRLVNNYFLSGKEEPYSLTTLKQICEHCSNCEYLAQQAERDSIKEMQMMWLRQFVGITLKAHIVSVVEYGFFVQLENCLCEGLVRMRQLYDFDHFEYIPDLYKWQGESGQYSFSVGDAVNVKIEKFNFEKRQIDFELVLTN